MHLSNFPCADLEVLLAAMRGAVAVRARQDARRGVADAARGEERQALRLREIRATTGKRLKPQATVPFNSTRAPQLANNYHESQNTSPSTLNIFPNSQNAVY